MRLIVSALTSVLAVGAALLAGVYVVAVLDAIAMRLVSGRRTALAITFLQPLRSTAGLLLKQRARTERPDRAAWALSAALLGAMAASAVAIVPLAPRLIAADIEAGIVLFGVAVAWVMVAVFLHGWSSNSAFPLIGGYRFIASALSYQIPLSLVLIGVALPAESLALDDIIRSQEGLWNVVRQPLGLPVFLLTGLGLTFWGPFAFPDAEDLGGGTAGEVSGAALLVWRAGQAAMLVAFAAMAAAAFLGGWLGPWLPGPVWVVVKTLALLALLVASRHVLGRIRLERFVWFGWVVLLPLALVDVFGVGLLLLLSQ